MPVGINVEDDPYNPGFVLVEFTDPSLKGPAFHTLITDGGPDIIEPLTREKGSERKRYRIPSGNAASAGLIDGSGVALDDITQTGPADASGIVLPDPGTTHENIHAPVIRRGSYKNGYGDNEVVTQPGNSVNVPEPTQAALAEYVHSKEHSLKEREGRDPNNNGTLGLVGTLSDSGQDGEDGPDGYPEGTPSMDWRRAELNAYAKAVKGIDTSDTGLYPAKADVLNAIAAA